MLNPFTTPSSGPADSNIRISVKILGTSIPGHGLTISDLTVSHMLGRRCDRVIYRKNQLRPHFHTVIRVETYLIINLNDAVIIHFSGLPILCTACTTAALYYTPRMTQFHSLITCTWDGWHEEPKTSENELALRPGIWELLTRFKNTCVHCSTKVPPALLLSRSLEYSYTSTAKCPPDNNVTLEENCLSRSHVLVTLVTAIYTRK